MTTICERIGGWAASLTEASVRAGGGPGRPAVRLRHRSCGELTHPLLVCSQCREPIGAQDVEVVLGTGDGAPI